MESSPWQKLRLRLYLHLIAIKRRITLGARVMMIDEDRIYLVRHTYLNGWQLPGGGVEAGEAADTSAAREVMEETGYRVTGPLELFALYHNTLTTNRDHVALYLCRSLEQDHQFTANHEIAEFGWFPLDALPSETSAATRRRIAEVFQGAARTGKWLAKGALSHEFQLWAGWDNAGRVDGDVAPVIVGLDVVHVDRFLDPRHLVERLEIVGEVLVVGDAAAVAFEVADIDGIEAQ